MISQILLKRINKELNDLEKQPRPGITCYPIEDNITQLEAFIEGPPETPYEQGLFKLSVQVPDRYPFEPPQIKFITRIYHPNIDDGGRICADILKTGDKGSWNPAINIGTALMSLRQLIAVPNPDDPLEVDIAQEFKLDYPTFEQKAKEYTKKYATGNDTLNAIDPISSQKKETIESISEPEKFLFEQVEEKPKKFLSLSKKKSSTSNSQHSSASQSSKDEKSDIKETKKLLSKSSNSLSSSPLSNDKVTDSVIIKKDEIKIIKSKKDDKLRIDDDEDLSKPVKEQNKKKVRTILIDDDDHDEGEEVKSKPVKEQKTKEDKKPLIDDEEDSNIIEQKTKKDEILLFSDGEDSSTVVKEKKTKILLKSKSKKPVLDAVDNTKDTIKKTVKRKAKELDEEDVIKEKASLKKCQHTKYPSNKPSNEDLKFPKTEMNNSSIFDTNEEINKVEDLLINENKKSFKFNDKDIASNAMNIISTIEENVKSTEKTIIELSDDDEDDIIDQRPIYHSFGKKSSKSKISLSRKKRSW